MPVKRRNHGRSKMSRGHTKLVNCVNCGKMIPKDKAIKRFAIKNMVDASSTKDISDASIFPGYELPKDYQKCFYCVSCAVHRRVVRPRSATTRRCRVPLFLRLRQLKADQRKSKKE